MQGASPDRSHSKQRLRKHNLLCSYSSVPHLRAAAAGVKTLAGDEPAHSAALNPAATHDRYLEQRMPLILTEEFEEGSRCSLLVKPLLRPYWWLRRCGFRAREWPSLSVG